MANTVKMRDVHFDKKLFENYCTQTTLARFNRLCTKV